MTYQALEDHHRRLSHLRHVEAIVGWDEAAMMPAGGGDARADALATLRGIIHERATEPRLGDLFAAAEASASSLDGWQAANLREMRREWVRATALPHDLVEASSRAETRSEQAWRELRAKNDWTGFLPFLREVVTLKRQVAQALADRLGLSNYDALLDGYEPGARSDAISPLFARLRSFLPEFISRVSEDQQKQAVIVPRGPFPVERQQWLGLELMRRVGFDFSHGRLDRSHHPFCGGVPQDVRITTRYDAGDFAKSLMGVLHETGHAKYEQNLPPNWLSQPVGAARGMSVHESQSLLLEMQVCRSRAFLEFATPLIAEAFPDAVRAQPEAFTVDNLARLATRVERSFIRVDADEATYPCHVVLRFEIEKSLIEGRVTVDQIPELWDAAMRDLLGLSTAGNYRDGCLQDVHWPAGLIGYFPTYTLGALTAAQLFRAARTHVPDLLTTIARGDFEPLDGWLREQVWGQGSLLETDALVRKATGSALSTTAFEQHLQERYLPRG
ncbi:MAG TPA: carboxypeptidase M32 [Polyangiaceae bacterium]|nr:carboxypeptidase M32 [Polyangiaceae bacterium]